MDDYSELLIGKLCPIFDKNRRVTLLKPIDKAAAVEGYCSFRIKLKGEKKERVIGLVLVLKIIKDKKYQYSPEEKWLRHWNF